MRKPLLFVGFAVLSVLMMSGCESINVGAGIPIPGPVKPRVGVNVSKKGVKGTAGVSAKVGPVPVGVSGTTKPLPGTAAEKK